jgi:hypothetical protein
MGYAFINFVEARDVLVFYHALIFGNMMKDPQFIPPVRGHTGYTYLGYTKTNNPGWIIASLVAFATWKYPHNTYSWHKLIGRQSL